MEEDHARSEDTCWYITQLSRNGGRGGASHSAFAAAAPGQVQPATLPGPVGPDWEVTGNGAAYQTIGAWQDCTIVQPSAQAQDPACTKTITVAIPSVARSLCL
jgi:hypothetical protein